MTSPVRPLSDLPLARSELDRDQLSRSSEGFVAEAIRDPRSRVVRLSGSLLPVRGGALVFESASVTRSTLEASVDDLVYLGRTLGDEGGVPVGSPILLAAALDPQGRDEGESGKDVEWLNPRDVAHGLSDRDAGIAAEALAIAGWHRSARFCSNCGTETLVRNAGWMRHCPNCGVEHFPRTDPAVIVRIVHDDRILLGSSVLWPSGRYSLLAGFVEAGESLEAAVLREVEEESGMRLSAPTYLGSQPWPFPRSIMFGFHAELAAGQDPAAISRDEEELDDVRWFSREELRADASVILPGPTSIARAIIDDWLDAPDVP
jgi:NAD+ diphosphatase